MAELLAVYDLSVSKVAFDCFNFLVLADLERRRVGVDWLRLLIVPADGGGFRPHVSHDLAQMRWRLQNLIVHGVALLPSCGGVALAGSRDEAAAQISAHEGPLHPKGYRVEAPVGHWENGLLTIACAAGDDIKVLEAGAQAGRYARQWIDAHSAGRRPIVLTLREARHNAHRNSNLDLWADFARALERRGHFPVVVRDTENALKPSPSVLDGIVQCPEAAFNVELRMALYEAAYLNFFVANGPVTFGFFSKTIRFVAFASGDWAARENSPAVNTGFRFGDQFPYLTPLQRFIWDEPSMDGLMREFEMMESRLTAHEMAGCPDTDLKLDPACLRPPIMLAHNFLATRNWEMVDAVAADAERRGTATDDLRAIRRTAGEQRRALLDDTTLFNQALDDKAAGKLDIAISTLQELVARRPTELQFYVELGLCLEATARLDEAEELYRAAVARKVASSELVYRLGCVAESLNHLDDARSCFEMLVGRGVGSEAARRHLAAIAARQA